MSFFEPDMLTRFHKVFTRKLNISNKAGKDRLTVPIGCSAEPVEKLKYEYKHLQEWYHEITFVELLHLWNIIDQFNGSFRNVLTMIFSSILKSSSSQTNHWGYVADNMKPRSKIYRDSIKLFLSSLQDFVDSSMQFVQNQAKHNMSAESLNARALIIRSDLRIAPPLTANSGRFGRYFSSLYECY